MIGLVKRNGWWISAGLAATLAATPAAAQQPQPSIEQRVGAEVGPIIVRAAALGIQVEQLNALVAQRDKTIADLQAQIAELKKPKPPE